jgi:hypothetical protein
MKLFFWHDKKCRLLLSEIKNSLSVRPSPGKDVQAGFEPPETIFEVLVKKEGNINSRVVVENNLF